MRDAYGEERLLVRKRTDIGEYGVPCIGADDTVEQGLNAGAQARFALVRGG